NDAGFADADVAPRTQALLGVSDCRAFHRPLHRPRAATGADIEAAQAEFVADGLGVVVLQARDRMSTPAHGQVGFDVRLEHARISQDVEHGVRDAVRIFQLESSSLHLCGDIDDVAYHGEQQLVDAADDAALDER